MNILTSKRLVVTALVLLTGLNVALLGVIWWQNKQTTTTPPCTPNSKSYRTKASPLAPLNLSAEQRTQFRTLRKEHQQSISDEMAEMALLKKSLIRESLKEQPNQATIEKLSRSIGSLQAKVEEERGRHFHAMAKICSPEQRDSLQTMLERFATKRHGKRGNNSNSAWQRR
uniref:Periplasmic heavy metal sensor n=1 Tax=Chlorobium chlorochromatii (strain CaD3) TaxID=340177 RepID=Q3ATD2_CHLCH